MSQSVDDDPAPEVVRRGYRFAILPEWVLYHRGLSDRAIRLFCVLDRFADADGACFPSRKTLAERMGTSIKTIDRAMAELGAAGAVTVEVRMREGRQTSNRYVLHGDPPGGGTDVSPLVRSDAGVGDRSDAQNESHLEREPSFEETVVREDDDRATVGSSSDDMAVYREAARIIHDSQPEPADNPVAFMAKVARNLSRERAGLLAQIRVSGGDDLDVDTLARWVAQDANPFTAGPFPDDQLEDLPAAFVD